MNKLLKILLILSSILLMNFNLNAYLVKNETGGFIEVIYLSDPPFPVKKRSILADNEFIELDPNQRRMICIQKGLEGEVLKMTPSYPYRSSYWLKRRIKVLENDLCFDPSNYDLEDRIFSIVKKESKTEQEIKKEELSPHLEKLPKDLSDFIIYEYYTPSKSVFDIKFSKGIEREKQLKLEKDAQIKLEKDARRAAQGRHIGGRGYICPIDCPRIEGDYDIVD